MKYYKVYILVKDTLDVGHAVNCAAHASLAMYLDHQDNPIVQDWAKNSFRKVSCKVTKEEFEHAKTLGPHVIITESHLEDQETVLITLPRNDFEPFFKTLKLYS